MQPVPLITLSRLAAAALLVLLTFAAPAAEETSFDNAVSAFAGMDFANARKQLEPLAHGGDATAQVLLGILYSEGKGVSRDLKKAQEWFAMADAQGDSYGSFMLGLAYLNDPARNRHREAVQLVQRAAAQGNPVAQRFLANAYKYGWIGLQKDLQQHSYWIGQAEPRQ